MPERKPHNMMLPENSLLKPVFFRVRRFSQPELQSIAHYFSIYKAGERGVVWDAITGDHISPIRLRFIAGLGKKRTKEKVEGIGLTLPEFFNTFSAFENDNIASLWDTAYKAHEKIQEKRKSIRSTAETHQVVIGNQKEYTQERQKLHRKIIDEIFAEKTPGGKTLYVVMGPNGGGKSEAAKLLMQGDNGDNVVRSDPDEIRKYLVDNFNPQNNALVQATHDESRYISDKILERAYQQQYSVLYEGSGSNYATYLRDIQKAIENGFTVKIAYVANDLQECFRRSIVYRKRGITLDVLLSSAKGFDNFFRLTGNKDLAPFIEKALILENLALHVQPEVLFENKTAVQAERLGYWKGYFKKFTDELERRERANLPVNAGSMNPR